MSDVALGVCHSADSAGAPGTATSIGGRGEAGPVTSSARPSVTTGDVGGATTEPVARTGAFAVPAGRLSDAHDASATATTAVSDHETW
jgi:hypothetical protein